MEQIEVFSDICSAENILTFRKRCMFRKWEHRSWLPAALYWDVQRILEGYHFHVSTSYQNRVINDIENGKIMKRMFECWITTEIACITQGYQKVQIPIIIPGSIEKSPEDSSNQLFLIIGVLWTETFFLVHYKVGVWHERGMLLCAQQ